MKQSNIKSVCVTVYRHSFSWHVFYKSGRSRCYFSPIVEFDKLLSYPLEFIRETRSFGALMQPLTNHGYMPKSLLKWIHEFRPDAAYRVNMFTSSVFEFNFFDPFCYGDTSAFGQTFNY